MKKVSTNYRAIPIFTDDTSESVLNINNMNINESDLFCCGEGQINKYHYKENVTVSFVLNKKDTGKKFKIKKIKKGVIQGIEPYFNGYILLIKRIK